MQKISTYVLKRLIIDTAYRAKKGHIGSALSIADLVEESLDLVIKGDRYHLVLSKGHGALALYCALYRQNLITESELNTYCADRTFFGTHPDPSIPHVEFIGGSLGQGVAFGTGMAHYFNQKNKRDRVIVILSDSELNTGILWEVLGIAHTQKLNNLILLMDNNKQQALGLTKDIVNYPNIELTISSLGWEVLHIDGHDKSQIKNAILSISNSPKFVIADTKFGGGLSFMEGNISWHYLPLSREYYIKSILEIEEFGL